MITPRPPDNHNLIAILLLCILSCTVGMLISAVIFGTDIG